MSTKKTITKKPATKVKASSPIKTRVGDYQGKPTITVWDSSKSAEPSFINGVTIGIGKAILLTSAHDALIKFISDNVE